MMADSFETISERILQKYLEMNPATARYLGLHEYDGQVPDLSAQALQNYVAWAEQELKNLDQLDSGSLSEQQQFDLALLRHNLAAIPFNINEMRDWEQNPLYYSQQLSLVNYLSRSYAPLPERLDAIARHQRRIPALLETVRANLKPPFARPVMEVAFQVFGGELRYPQGDLAQEIDKASLTEAQRKESEEANREAIAALESFIAYLKKESENSHDNFAIGRDKYQKLLFHGDMVDLPVEEVLAAGERDLERNYAEFEEVARQIDPNATPDEIRDRLKDEHPSADELIPYTEKLLEEIRSYLVEKDLITIPSEIRPIVAETPPQSRWSFASMATPGPFEKATEAYYYITLPEKDWPYEKQKEWLTAYSFTTMEDISIHEVYPGHYIHFLHFQNAPSRVTKIMRGSTAHSEGWAHYCEQMMLEEGYGAGNPEVKLAQLDAALKRDCRYIAAIKMHTQGMSVEDATRLFMKYAHMAEHPARTEALRGTWQPGYLAYTLGKLMILKMREDLKQREGSNFNLKAFHDACVGNGVPPVPLLRRKLLGENSGAVL
ncbi:MAG TPA: DUF885 domain-containing protein [Chloroflexia bacterium]|nr:DUF885 domain-containing protein [Chloroflexia bacterium]